MTGEVSDENQTGTDGMLQNDSCLSSTALITNCRRSCCSKVLIHSYFPKALNDTFCNTFSPFYIERFLRHHKVDRDGK